MTEQTLAEEMAEEFEDDDDRRAFRSMTDIEQTHLSARWWS